jgi:hypothetical protein
MVAVVVGVDFVIVPTVAAAVGHGPGTGGGTRKPLPSIPGASGPLRFVGEPATRWTRFKPEHDRT